MSEKEISLVIGTAGHIDHGKTQLVRALTGVNCDRLSEERKRGITIELGFAPLKLPSKRIISIIDVPGHEKFIRQMVAGASGLDAVMLVVAADEGVMPQTREHLEILNLLGVTDGLIVISKIDLVDEEMLELAVDDVMDLTKGTFLEGKPLITVSSITGENIDDLKSQLERLVDTVSPRKRIGAYFMPIDRAFPVAGFGTVVTGTSYRGRIRSGAEVNILPNGKACRVRSIQVHGASVKEAGAGQRVAMSLSGVSVDELKRGDVICDAGVFKNTNCLDVHLRLLASSPEPLKHWQRVRLHLGTSDVLARVSLLEGKSLLPGEETIAQLVVEENVVASLHQRFVIRFYSPLQTIGGGSVLFPYGRKPRGRVHRKKYINLLREFLEAKTKKDRVKVLLSHHGVLSLNDLIFDMQESKGDLLSSVMHMRDQSELVFLKVGSGVLFSMEFRDQEKERIVKYVQSFHREHSQQNGVALDALVNELFLAQDRRLGRALMEYFAEKEVLVIAENLVRMPDFFPRDNEAFQRDANRLLELCARSKFQPPSIEDASKALSMEEKVFSDLLKELKQMGRVNIVDGMFILSDEVERELLDVLREADTVITIASVRDITGSSRKFVVPLLEYLDSRRITRRVGDKRIILKK